MSDGWFSFDQSNGQKLFIYPKIAQEQLPNCYLFKICFVSFDDSVNESVIKAFSFILAL